MFIEIHNQNLTFVVVAWFPSSLIWVVLYLKIMEAAWFCVYWNWEYQLELEKKQRIRRFSKTLLYLYLVLALFLYFSQLILFLHCSDFGRVKAMFKFASFCFFYSLFECQLSQKSFEMKSCWVLFTQVKSSSFEKSIFAKISWHFSMLCGV